MKREAAIETSSQGKPVTIAVSNVKKYFGPTRALDGCSFSAVAGEIHAVVGGNGCGKSTMAKVVSGVLEIDSGTVSILGETPTTPAESRAIGIATVFQEVLVADECSVVDNLFMGADDLFSNVIPWDEKIERAARMMRELSGEAVDPLALAGTLPLNIKQWITIARAMLANPKILILDEILSGARSRQHAPPVRQDARDARCRHHHPHRHAPHCRTHRNLRPSHRAARWP
ncbi:ATP-binding cassette domain-containing protein [Aestuariivirga sp.]|uniref:ATP-binding cassette domain-containing protein n=1 Tax=Aestuariivirga sp. TaxID=2650926 RepID=UPI0039E59EA9